ncbi:MAG TPA: hypothetical protein VG477_05335, partial [Thermoanaerobaculia bacterium]|nr:hypothetical protein [Thermoanaerobaculia bacterium]
MSFKSRDLTVKLSEGDGEKCGCTNTQPGCGNCTPTRPDCGGCSPSPDHPIECTLTKVTTERYAGSPDSDGAGLAMLRQQLQETLRAAP